MLGEATPGLVAGRRRNVFGISDLSGSLSRQRHDYRIECGAPCGYQPWSQHRRCGNDRPRRISRSQEIFAALGDLCQIPPQTNHHHRHRRWRSYRSGDMVYHKRSLTERHRLTIASLFLAVVYRMDHFYLGSGRHSYLLLHVG